MGEKQGISISKKLKNKFAILNPALRWKIPKTYAIYQLKIQHFSIMNKCEFSIPK